MPAPKLPNDLLAVIAHLERPAELQRLFEDLFTPAELDAVCERWAIVNRLAAGESQRHIRDAVGASVSTVSRGSRQLKYGSGGFALAFERLAAMAGESTSDGGADA